MRRDYELSRRGDDTSKPIQFGRAVYDAHLTEGDNTLTSATAGFATATDVGAIIQGLGIPDGTTVASVTNGTTIEMSAPPTQTAILTRRVLVPGEPRLKGLVVQARDMSGWTFLSQIRKTEQSTGDPLGAANIVTTNAVTGLLLWQVLHAVSAALPEFSFYDLQGIRTSDGWKKTWQFGKLITPPDVTR